MKFGRCLWSYRCLYLPHTTPICLSLYLRTYLPTYLPTYLSNTHPWCICVWRVFVFSVCCNHLPAYPPAYVPTYLPTHLVGPVPRKPTWSRLGGTGGSSSQESENHAIDAHSAGKLHQLGPSLCFFCVWCLGEGSWGCVCVRVCGWFVCCACCVYT